MNRLKVMEMFQHFSSNKEAEQSRCGATAFDLLLYGNTTVIVVPNSSILP